VVGLAMVGLLGAGFATRGLLDNASAQVATNAAAASAVPASAANATPFVTGSDEEPVVAVAKALGPSVVLIKTESGLGSGVVYDSKGLIFTNAHVVGDAETVNVQLSAARPSGQGPRADTDNDIAVVQVEPATTSWPPGCDRLPQVGSLAVGIGSPFGLDRPSPPVWSARSTVRSTTRTAPSAT
jgi:S1-C subfamily serine protease